MTEKANADAGWYLYVWDIKTGKSKKSNFYKKLNGYQQRKYVGVVDEHRAVAERLRGKDLVSVDPEELPKDIDGVTKDGRLYRFYEYQGVLEEIPPKHRIRLNDSTYVFFEPATPKIEELLEEYRNIFKSLYKIPIIKWGEIEDLVPEGENGD